MIKRIEQWLEIDLRILENISIRLALFLIFIVGLATIIVHLRW